MNWARFAIVGHPNKGKSSIVATLAEDDAVAISPHPGTTTAARAYPMRLDGETLYELIDTPGFQRARETLAWLQAHDRGAGARADVVGEFLQAHEADPRLHDERELLKPILGGAGILYVVDGSRPYGRRYEAEMEILRWTGRPRMALINLISAGDHVEEWRAALTQYFSIVRVFDAVHADFGKRIELLRAFGAIDESWAAPLNRAADALTAERERRKRLAAGEIAELLIAVLTAAVTVPLRDRKADEEAREKARTQLQDAVRRRERAARRGVQELYHHPGLEAHESSAAYLVEDVFSARSFSVFGLSATQLALTGAASGAVVGGAIDAVLGGASLLLGAGIGAAFGAFGTVAGAGRLAKVEVLGQPLGGFELRVGPITDPNLPWVVLGRALLHVKLLAERNHARREKFVVDAETGAHLADAIDATRRRKLDAVFRALRSERGIDKAQRDALVEEIAALIDGAGVSVSETQDRE
jgi:GTPase Era involved in 16S rRNA processing